MGISKKEACALLNVSPDCKTKDIEKSYKRLALEWFPQKHSYSALANEKFKQISHAYRTLMSSDKKQEDMNMSEMIALFQKVFFKQGGNSSYPGQVKELDSNYCDLASDSDEISDDDEDYDNDSYEDIDDDDGYEMDSDEIVAGIIQHVVSSAIERKSSAFRSLKDKEVEAEKNARELVAEEEKEKKKAEKRRAKKKRRKEKRKQEKTEAQKKNEDKNLEPEKSQSSSGSEEEGLDPTSAFVAVVANKKLSGTSQASASKSNDARLRRSAKSDAQDDNTDLQSIDPIILQSRQLAIRGNQMAAMDEFAAAISFFTAAIKLDPHDFRYFGNRSYCYERSDNFERAFKDAERAILLDPLWPKGHFRKGRALCGLQRYAEAELCFQEVIKLDKNCTEAFTELIAARTSGIMEMGFPRQLAETSAAKYSSIQDAVDVLVQESASSSRQQANWGTTKGATNGYQSSEIYESDDEAPDELNVQARMNKAILKDDKMDPRNSENRTSLWVGNLRKEATEKSITSLFSKYGELMSVRVLLESRCAFVNYKSPYSASRAMETLQGMEYFGDHLLIRFPNHNHIVGQPSVTVLKRKPPTTKTKSLNPDFKGPVNGDECYFWRLAGCIHGNKCRYKHVPKHKGVDLK